MLAYQPLGYQARGVGGGRELPLLLAPIAEDGELRELRVALPLADGGRRKREVKRGVFVVRGEVEEVAVR